MGITNPPKLLFNIKLQGNSNIHLTIAFSDGHFENMAITQVAQGHLGLQRV
jgi:hypothetical protein